MAQRGHRSAITERIGTECLCSPLRLLHRFVTGIYDEALRPHGINIAQLNLLVAVDSMGEDASPARVAKALVLEKSSLSRDLDRLVQQRWLERTPSPSGRGQLLKLTPAGHRILEKALPAWEQAQARAREWLDEKDGKAVVGLARRIRRSAFET